MRVYKAIQEGVWPKYTLNMHISLLHQSHVINNYKTNDFLTVQTVLLQTVLQTLLLIKYYYLNSFILIIKCMPMFV